MATTIKISGSKKKLALLGFLIFSINAFAESTQGAVVENQKNQHAGFYIIGGVLAFGLVAFLINKLASKYNHEEEDYQGNHRFISHRRHHHHKVIKKSA